MCARASTKSPLTRTIHAFAVAPRYGLSAAAARAIAGEVGLAVRPWRGVGAEFNISKDQLDRMSSAFEHADLRLALANQTKKPAPAETSVKSRSPNVTKQTGEKRSERLAKETSQKRAPKKKAPKKTK